MAVHVARELLAECFYVIIHLFSPVNVLPLMHEFTPAASGADSRPSSAFHLISVFYIHATPSILFITV
jgi:hypothetical protein